MPAIKSAEGSPHASRMCSVGTTVASTSSRQRTRAHSVHDLSSIWHFHVRRHKHSCAHRGFNKRHTSRRRHFLLSPLGQMAALAINYKHTLDSYVDSYCPTILFGGVLPSINYHSRHRARFSKAERTNSRNLSGRISYTLCVARAYLGRQS